MIIDPKFIDAAQRSHAKVYPKGPFTSVILAQFGIESAWGKEPSGKNNYFGIKANKSQIVAGKYTSRWTHETLSTEQYVKLAQYFADYDNLEACFDAHATLLCTPHYIDCQRAATPEDYCHALWKDGYATGIPGHPYDTVLINIISTMNLKQYDLPRATVLALKESMMVDTPAPTAAVTPPPPVLQTAHAPTVSGPITIDWGSFVSQILSHETPIIETVAQAGVSLVLHEIPLGSFIENFITPKVVKQYVDMALVAVQGGLEGQSLELPSTGIAGNVASIAENLFRQGEPELVAFLGGTIGTWITEAVGKLGLSPQT